MGKAFITAVFAFLCFTAQAKDKERLHMAVASSMSLVTQKASEVFEEIYPLCDISLSIAGSSRLYNNIIQGADYHIFMGADKAWPQKLQQSLSLPHPPIAYAEGQALLWLKEGDRININQEIVISNPLTTPYGQAAYDWLKNEGLWDELKHHKKIITAGSAAKIAFTVNQGGFKQAILPRSFLGDLPPQAFDKSIALMTHYMLSLKPSHCQKNWEDFIKNNPQFEDILKTHFYEKP